MSSSEPYGCSLLLASYRFAQFFLQTASREFPYGEISWFYHFYSQTKYDFYDVLCTYFFSSFLCVCIKGHSVDDWVILAVLLRSGVLFFFLSWGAHFFQNWLWHQFTICLLQNGVRGKLVGLYAVLTQLCGGAATHMRWSNRTADLREHHVLSWIFGCFQVTG